MWVEASTGDSLMIPYNDASETFLNAQFSSLVEKPNNSFVKTHKAYVLPSSGSDLTKFNSLLDANCSHTVITHDTCDEDPDCDSKIRLIPQAS
tara:strand:- start:8446 stop:8724 length:279 start_codon:yes stop_codon:yes gene_type:complete